MSNDRIVLDGTCTLTSTLNGSCTLTSTLDGSAISVLQVGDYEYYTGTYEVTSFVAQPLLTTSLILPTTDKHMHDDVTVYSVPTREEYNEAGGVTFTIGENLDGS